MYGAKRETWTLTSGTLDPKSSASANSAILALFNFKKKWCRLSESNQSPTDYKSVALPDELKRHNKYGGSDEGRTRDLMRDRHAL